jgi:hypothetical protein
LDSAAQSAAIAAAVALAGATLSYVGAQRALRTGLEQWERDQRRRMTERLYERRLAAYPKALSLTEPLRGGNLRDFRGDTAQLQRQILSELETWRSTDAGFLLSGTSLDSLYALREALSTDPEGKDRFTDADIERLFDAKNVFRRALHSDIRLLFSEDGD